MTKRPAEILGYAIDLFPFAKGVSNIERQCPFMHGRCTKTNATCSVEHGKSVVAICPNRFLQSRLIFEEIATNHFGTKDNILVFSEVHSGDKSLGSFDYVMVKHKPLSDEVEDFVIVEFQTVDTTNTGALNTAVADFWADGEVSHYNFGLNWANVWKRCFIQILNKGRVLEQWGHKAYWVVQEPAYQHLLISYGLKNSLTPGSESSTVFLVCDLALQGNQYSLYSSRIESTTVKKLQEAFISNPHIPSLNKFVANLQQKAQSAIKFRL
ncbi:MAG: hypothetical protein KA314_20585 [Chloroflexi bacterium]|nr:hypothetical protein [Chloroflexota bacterium]MBP8058236.1 hypothetical protein [Chloroflexota bacterium]